MSHALEQHLAGIMNNARQKQVLSSYVDSVVSDQTGHLHRDRIAVLTIYLLGRVSLTLQWTS